jgi:para-aminobenzoate synthetase component I
MKKDYLGYSLKELVEKLPKDEKIMIIPINEGTDQLVIWKPLLTIKWNERLIVESLIDDLNLGLDNPLNFSSLIPNILNTILEYFQQRFFKSEELNSLFEFVGLYGFISYEAGRMLNHYNSIKNYFATPFSTLILPNYIYKVSSGEIITLIADEDIFKDGISEIRSNFVLEDNDGVSDSLYEKSIIQTSLKYPIQNVSFLDYINSIEKTLKYIENGDIYQANITQQFRIYEKFDKTKSLALFLGKINNYDVKYKGYVETDELKIISASPELFLLTKQGKAKTKPIKGTRPRGITQKEDNELKNELLSSEKDVSELSMIVDLLRNDLGKSSLSGSVKVTNHAEIESYSNVHHLVSTIESEIEDTVSNAWRLFLRAFPGGSISGCPKMRALEIIEELETVPRGVYTGSIGYITCLAQSEWNIAIRTIQIFDDYIDVYAGGGIVLDSNPYDEYIESLHKAKHLISVFNFTFKGHIFWLNGKYFHKNKYTEMLKQIQNSKDGCFETIRIKNKKPRNLRSHYHRLQNGIKYYGLNHIDLPSIDEIEQLVKLNLIESGRLKIIIAIDKDNEIEILNNDMNVIRFMEIQDYEEPNDPLQLLLHDKPFSIPQTTSHGVKSNNYQIYRDLVLTAVGKNCFDSILYDSTDMVLEGSRCTLYVKLQESDHWLTPQKNIIPGTMRKIIVKNNLAKEFDFSLNDLLRAEEICVSNSLIGIKSVNKILDHTGDIVWEANSTVYSNKLKNLLNSILNSF